MSALSTDTRGPLALAWSRFVKHRLALVSFAVLLLLAIVALAAPWITEALGVSATKSNLYNRLAPPSWPHVLGTDELGRDVFARVLYGGQVSLAVGLVAALTATFIGTFVGLIAGYAGGKTDTILMRFTDGVIALPVLPLLIVLAAIDLTKLGVSPEVAQSPAIAVLRIVLIIAIVGWTTVARLVRGATLSVRERDYVMAARAMGAGPGRLMLVHILPNVVSPALVATTLSMGNVILVESALSFLGLGVQPPVPTWGNMLNGALELVWSAPMMTVWPGLMIFITVIAINFLGDGLQDALDPTSRRRS